MSKTNNKWVFLTMLIPRGSENAIEGERLDRMLNCERRTRFELIEKARRDGEIICANQTGYYLPETLDELHNYYKFSRKKALSILECLKPVRQKLVASGIKVR